MGVVNIGLISKGTDEWQSLCCQRWTGAELRRFCRAALPSSFRAGAGGLKAGVKGQFGLKQLSSRARILRAMSFDRNGLRGDEDRWLVVIQSTHMLFCDCKDFKQHLAQLLGWRTPPGEERGTTTDSEDGGGRDDTDALLLAALDAAEGTGEEVEEG